MGKLAGSANTQVTALEDLLRTLVAFPTVTNEHAGVNLDAITYVENYLSRRGMHTTLFNWEHPALIATTRKNHKTPAVFLVAHLDVVPASPNMFFMKKEGGKLYGRGVWDMKFALAVYMQLAEAIKDHVQDFDFGIMVTTDEETGAHGSANGVERLLFDEGYSSACAVVPDGGQDWQIETFAKGHMRFTLHASGKAAHGSRPWEGDNALDRLTKALYLISRHLKKQGPGDNTLNIGTVHGGKTFNVVADSADAEIEVRTLTNNDALKITKVIQKICAIHRVNVSTDTPIEPIAHDLQNAFLKQFATNIQKVTGIKNVGSKSFGSTDARHFVRADIPAVVVRPPGGGIHADDEWIDAAGFAQFEKVIYDFIHHTCLRSSANIDPISNDKRLG